jgi:hypothetical protein
MQDNMNALKHNFLLSGFFKNRGYDDPAQLTRHLIPSLPRGEPTASIPIRSAKLFAADDSAKLKDTKVLDEAGRALAAGSFGLAVVVARGGPTGDSGDLEMLAQARAMNVRDYLVEHYPMDDTRLKTFAVAKTPEPNGDSSIEVRIYPAGTRVTPDEIRTLTDIRGRLQWRRLKLLIASLTDAGRPAARQLTSPVHQQWLHGIPRERRFSAAVSFTTSHIGPAAPGPIGGVPTITCANASATSATTFPMAYVAFHAGAHDLGHGRDV